MAMISGKVVRLNQKLTDFEATKALVLSNTIKDVPGGLKKRCSCVDSCIYDYM